MECETCKQELIVADTAYHARTGKHTMTLYECGNEDCEDYRGNFMWEDDRGNTHEGAWHL